MQSKFYTIQVRREIPLSKYASWFDVDIMDIYNHNRPTIFYDRKLAESSIERLVKIYPGKEFRIQAYKVVEDNE